MWILNLENQETVLIIPTLQYNTYSYGYNITYEVFMKEISIII